MAIEILQKKIMKIPIIRSKQGNTYKAGYPINTYLFFIAPVVLICLFLFCGLNILVLAVYLPIAAIPHYMIFARKSSRIEISNHEMKIIYFFPWDTDITLDLREFEYLDYARGIYHPFNGNLSVVRVCYDLIILSDNIKEAQIEVKVNIRAFTFRKTIKYLQNKSNLKLTCLISIYDMIL